MQSIGYPKLGLGLWHHLRDRGILSHNKSFFEYSGEFFFYVFVPDHLMSKFNEKVIRYIFMGYDN